VPRKKVVSWSQLSMYDACPRQWKLSYIDKLAKRESSIHLIFGIAMHNVIQSYLKTLYASTVREANELPLMEMLETDMKKRFTSAYEKQGTFPATKEEMLEFFYDGEKILNYLVSHQNEYFPKKNHRLLGIEKSLSDPINDGLNFIGYLDVVILNEATNTIKIMDLKTSTNGWNKWQKADKGKTNQLLLYKHFYSKLYEVELKDIEVEFLIVKRKLYENVDYYQKRFQKVKPASGKPSIGKVLRTFEAFLDAAFDESGAYKTERNYIAVAGKNKKNCRWCEFADQPEHCDPIDRLKE
jgi:hypothetical protein